MMDLKTLTLTIEDGIAVVTLNRPPVNAQNAEMRAEITEVFDTLSDMDEVAAIVLTGSGKLFSAGADIRERPNLAATPGAYGRHNRLVRESYYAVVECSKPVIAAINGAALGAGFGLVMGSDIWVASEDAYVSMPEINVGLAGGVTFLQKFFSQSMGIAREIASKSPIAVRLAKEAARMTLTMPPRDAYRYEQGNTVALSKTEDTKEAQRAFFEKRKPVFTGR